MSEPSLSQPPDYHKEPCDRQTLLDHFSQRQFLHPNEPIDQSLRAGVQRLGICPVAIEQCVKWLGLNVQQPIGRLKRTELKQLAASLERIWRSQAQIQPHHG